jgi:hypothetical protein
LPAIETKAATMSSSRALMPTPGRRRPCRAVVVAQRQAPVQDLVRDLTGGEAAGEGEGTIPDGHRTVSVAPQRPC